MNSLKNIYYRLKNSSITRILGGKNYRDFAREITMIEVNVLVSEPEICNTTFFYISERHDSEYCDIRGPVCINSTLPHLILKVVCICLKEQKFCYRKSLPSNSLISSFCYVL